MGAQARRVILWAGLLLCGYALWRLRGEAGEALAGLGWRGWLAIVALLVLCWGGSVAAWRRYLLAYTARDPGWRVAARQLGLLLVGKYVPGGVFGFLARVYDQPAPERAAVVWAGIAEQAVGIGLSVALGGVLFLGAESSGVWGVLVLPMPFVAMAGVWLLHRCAAFLPWLRGQADIAPHWPALLHALSLHLLQLLAWTALIAALAFVLFGMGPHASMGVAGAFLLAVGAGMLVMFMPGGIGVREAVLVALAGRWLDLPQAVMLATLLRLLACMLDVGAGALAALIGNTARSPG